MKKHYPYEVPELNIFALDTKKVICDSLNNFGDTGYAGGDIDGDDIVDGGSF